MRTFTPRPSDITRQWHVIDAEGAILGRLATEVATLLRGKHKPIWAPHVDTGDHVIVDQRVQAGGLAAQGEATSCTTGTPATRAASAPRASSTCSPATPRRSCGWP